MFAFGVIVKLLVGPENVFELYIQQNLQCFDEGANEASGFLTTNNILIA